MPLVRPWPMIVRAEPRREANSGGEAAADGPKMELSGKLVNTFISAKMLGMLTRSSPHIAGEQMWQGLKPWDWASATVEKPTRFFSEMLLTQLQFSR
jgi:hypothetical protein